MQPRFHGEESSLWNNFNFYKTRHILLSHSANCTVIRAVVLTQHRRVTDGRTDGQMDGQTDGTAVASTALAMRRAEKKTNSNELKTNKRLDWMRLKKVRLELLAEAGAR